MLDRTLIEKSRPAIDRGAPVKFEMAINNTNRSAGAMLSGTVAKQYGAKRSWLPALPVKRKTFVIDADRTILEVFSSEMKFDEHADRALAVLRGRSTA